MFVVKRPFRNLGKVHTVGSVITDPTAIKRFKGKLAEGKIIEVTEQTYDVVVKYFKAKYNVDLPPMLAEASVEQETSEASVEQETSKASVEQETSEASVEQETSDTVKVKATPNEVKAKAKAVVK